MTISIYNIIPFLTHSNKIEPLLIELLQKLGAVYPGSLETFGERIPPLEKWIVDQLKSKSKTLEEKSKIFVLLPLIVGPNDNENLAISEALSELQNQHIPLSSTEFSESSLKQTSLKHAYKAFLTALVTSRSYIILNFIIISTATDQKHLVEYMIKEELKNLMDILNDEQQVHIMNEVFNFLVKESFDPEIRYNILKRFMITLFENASENSSYEFGLTNIKKIVEMLTSDLGNESKGWAVNHALVNRIIAYSLLELYYAKVSEARDISNGAVMFKKGFGNNPTANKMTGALCKICYNARQIIFASENELTKELFRIYQCAAYKCMCAIVCNTQTKIEFFSKFLLDEGKVKLWRRLLDTDKQYLKETQQFEKLPKIKEKFLAIRKLNNSLPSSLLMKSAKFLQTQHVFESSLSMDVSEIDMNFCLIRNDAEVNHQRFNHFENNISVLLENHDLNKHEVMPVLCGVLRHMLESKLIHPNHDKNFNRRVGWVQCFVDSISNAESPRCVRVFLVQVIDNCRDIFDTYAYMLFKPIAQVLVDECAGKGLNFFITDVISLLLSWCKY